MYRKEYIRGEIHRAIADTIRLQDIERQTEEANKREFQRITLEKIKRDQAESFARNLLSRRLEDERIEREAKKNIFCTTQNKTELQVDHVPVGDFWDIFNLDQFVKRPPRSTFDRNMIRERSRIPKWTGSNPHLAHQLSEDAVPPEPRNRKAARSVTETPKVNLGKEAEKEASPAKESRMNSLHLAHQTHEHSVPSFPPASLSNEIIGNAYPVNNGRQTGFRRRVENDNNRNRSSEERDGPSRKITMGMSVMAKRLFEQELNRDLSQVSEGAIYKDTVPSENPTSFSVEDISLLTEGLSHTAKRLFEFEYYRTIAEKKNVNRKRRGRGNGNRSSSVIAEATILRDLALEKSTLQDDNKPKLQKRNKVPHITHHLSSPILVNSIQSSSKEEHFGLRRSSKIASSSTLSGAPIVRDTSTSMIFDLPMSHSHSSEVYSFKPSGKKETWVSFLRRKLAMWTSSKN